LTTLPAGWREVILADVALLLRNGIFARRPNSEQRGTAMLRISAVRDGRVDLNDRRHVEDVEAASVPRFSVREGDLLFTRYNGSRALVGICGRVGPVHEPLLHPDKLIRLVPDRDVVDDRFLALQMQSGPVRRFLEPRIRTTAGQSGISGADVRAIPIVLPPLDEQHRIVAVLEDKLSRLEAGKAYLRAGSQRANQLSPALLSTLRSVDDQRVALAEVLAEPLSNGRSVPDGDGAPVLRLTALRDGTVDPSAAKLGAWSLEQAAPFGIEQGDLLLARGNGSLGLVGRAAMVVDPPPAVAFPDTMIRLRPDPRAQPALLLALWNGPDVRRQIERAVRTTAGIYKINQKQLLGIRLRIPPPAQQVDVLAQLDALAAGRRRLESALEQSGNRAGALRRSLLTAAFEGSL
jgi:type I restriction enzyme S subunit